MPFIKNTVAESFDYFSAEGNCEALLKALAKQ
jgi:hypothetical protein